MKLDVQNLKYFQLCQRWSISGCIGQESFQTAKLDQALHKSRLAIDKLTEDSLRRGIASQANPNMFDGKP